MTVTRAELDALRASLAKPRLDLTLTPDNAIETQVHTTLFQQQQKRLKQGEQSLTEAQQNLHRALDELRQETGLQHDFTQATHTVECNQQL